MSENIINVTDSGEQDSISLPEVSRDSPYSPLAAYSVNGSVEPTPPPSPPSVDR